MWRWFQKAYNKIDNWDVSPDTKKKIAEIDKRMPEFITKALLSLVTSMYKRYSKEYVNLQIGNVKEYLNTLQEDK